MTNHSTSSQCTNCKAYSHEKAAGSPCAANADGNHYWSALTCLDHRDGNGTACSGDLPEYRFGYGLAGSYVRCGGHHATYLERAAEVRERYPDSPLPPADFDPTYAGEHWDEP